jgi:DNA-binding CsgD family transcriptional regulator
MKTSRASASGKSRADHDRLLAALYGAALGTRSWTEALELLSVLTSTRCITLDTYDLEQHAGTVLACNIEPHQAVEEYNQRYGRHNRLIEDSLPHIYPGAVYNASQLIPDKVFLKTDLYNLVYRTLGLKHVMSVFLECTHRSTAQFTVIKPDDAPDFSAAELAVFHDLKPHLEQAWLGHRHLAQTRKQLQTLSELWDCFEHAVVVVDAHQRIHFANSAGEALLRDGRWLVSHAGFLRMSDLTQAEILQRAIAQVARGQREIHCLTPATATGAAGMIATLFQVSSDRIALVITDPSRSAQDFRDGLASVFGLTGMEANLVNDLIHGRSVREYAADRDVSYETARTHLKNAMQKNGWRRQGEMIAAVLKRLLPLGSFG